MTGIGIVGLGFMGMIHALAVRRLANGKLAAIVSRDPKKRAGDWTSIKGNFGPQGKQEDLTGVHPFADSADLLRDPSVGLVDICLPTDQHANVAIAALEAGKHVLVEKPIALSLAEADRMVAASKQSGKLLMVAHVLPYFPDFKLALRAIKSGEQGRLIAAHFRRHICPPNWSDAVRDAAKTGGPVLDLHIHDTHFIALACGMPQAVQSVGVRREGIAQYVSTNYLYANGPAISGTSGALTACARPFTHGFELFFEKATYLYEAGGPLTVFGPEKFTQPSIPSADPVDAFVAELEAALDGIEGNASPPELGYTAAQQALALCLAEQQSLITGQIVKVC